MRLHMTINKLKLDKGRLLKEFKDVIKEHIIESLYVFGAEAAPNVPIDTGMARGTFLNLAHLVEQYGYSIQNIPVEPQRTNKDGTPLRYYHVGGRKMDKTPESGRELTTQSKDILKIRGNSYEVNYQTTVVHYNILDEYGAGTQSPWGSFSAGREQLLAHMQMLRLKVPRLNKFVLQTTVSLGKGAPKGIDPFRFRKQRTI